MDCFKIEKETLRYINNQQQCYNLIIQTLSFLSKFNSAIINLYPQVTNKKVSNTSHKSLPTCTKYNIPDACIDEESSSQELTQISMNVPEVSKELSLQDGYQMLKIYMSQEARSKQEKYLLMMDISCVYFRMMMGINFESIYNPQIATMVDKNSIMLRNKKTKLQEIELKFQQYMDEYIREGGHENNVPILVKFCYRLLDLHKIIWRNKNLNEVRDYCLQFKETIKEDIAKQDAKQKWRKQFHEREKKKEEEQGATKVRRTNKKKSLFKKELENKSNREIKEEDEEEQKENKITEQVQEQQQPRVISFQRKGNKSKTILTTVSAISASSHLLMLSEWPELNWWQRFGNIPEVEEYYRIFVWKINACLLLINQVQRKNAWPKDQLITFLKMGQWMRQKYHKTEAQTPILQQIMNGYSTTIANSYKLKQCKYYDMLILQLQISYKRISKLKKKQQASSSKNLKKSASSKSITNLSNNAIQANLSNQNKTSIIKSKLDKHKKSNIIYQNLKVQSNTNTNELTVKKNKVQKNVSFKNIDQDNYIQQSKGSQIPYRQEQREKQKYYGCNYEFIHKQLQQIAKKKDEEIFCQYLDKGKTMGKQDQIKLIQNEKKRKEQFTKSLHYLTQRENKSLHGCTFRNGKFKINLKEVIENQTQKISERRYNNSLSPHQSARSVYNAFQAALFMRYAESQQKSKGSQRSIRTARKGLMINRDSFKKEISNMVSMAKRNIKPSKYFDQVKGNEDNIYRDIISTEQRVTVLTNQMMIYEMDQKIYAVVNKKPVPLYEEILLLTKGKDKNKGNAREKQEYSFEKIHVTMANTEHHSSAFGNVSLIENISQIKILDMVQITLIQCYAREIGFVKIKMHKNKENPLNQIIFTSQYRKMQEQNLTVVEKPDDNQRRNKKDEWQYKTYFSFDELKNQINDSQFYFELIQQKIEKKIQNSDIQYIASYLHKQESRRSRQSDFRSNSDKENNSIIFEKDKETINMESLFFVGMSRMAHSLIYWYYTKGSKINGNILLKREIPYISDPLKFAIALEFMKKYNYKVCLEKLGNVRNKVALYQCLRYLLYGRKILVKGLVFCRRNFVFYTLSLEHFRERNFQIRSEQQGGSYFCDLEFTLTLYNITSWNVIQVHSYPVNRVLNQQKITYMMLSNIIQDAIPAAYLRQLVRDIEFKQSDQIYSSHGEYQNKIYQVIQPTSEEKTNLIRIYAVSIEQTKNKIIMNVVNLIIWYINLKEGSMNLTIKDKHEKIVKIQDEYMKIQEIYLGCGLIVQIIRNVKNKGKFHHILIFEENDFVFMKEIASADTQMKKSSIRKYEMFEREESIISSTSELNKMKIKQRRKLIRTQSNQDYKITYRPREKKEEFSSTFNNVEWAAQTSPMKFCHSKLKSIEEIPENNGCKQKNVNCSIEEQSKYSSQLSKCEYKIIKSPYHSKIGLRYKDFPNCLLVNRIKKSVVEKTQLDCLQVLKKKVLKMNGIYYYICLSFNKLIKSYRIDVYNSGSSRRFATYFKLSEYISMSTKQSIMKSLTSKTQLMSMSQNNEKRSSAERIYRELKQSRQLKQMDYYFQNRLYSKKQIPNKIFEKNDHFIMQEMFTKNQINISQDLKYIIINLNIPLSKSKGIKQSQIKIPIFQIFNNLSAYSTHTWSKIQLTEINSKLFLFVLIENQSNLHISQVDDNPFTNNNANLFADYPMKQHLINLYTHLFNRVYMKFMSNGLMLTEITNLKDIANL